MIEIKGLTKRYGRTVAVEGLSAVIEDDCVYGFLGPNGAGKTTTLNIITGCLAASEGTVKINGHDIYEEPVAAKRCLGYLPEQPPLYPDMTTREYLSFVAEAKGVEKDKRDKAVERVMRRVNVGDMADRLIKQLSKGYRQRVGVAQALLGDPDIIILDEPTVGLDPLQVTEMRELIKSLSESHTVIFSSHILYEVSLLCDRVLIIAGGRLIAEDTPEGLSRRLRQSACLRVTVKGGAEQTKKLLSGVEGELTAGEPDEHGYTELTLRCAAEADPREEVSRRLMEGGLAIISMSLDSASLEEVFLELTGGEAPEAEPEKEGDE